MAFIGALITWVVAGALLGWIASILSGRTDRIGCLSNMMSGEIGAVIGGLLATLFGSASVLIWAVLLGLGAIVLVNRFFTA